MANKKVTEEQKKLMRIMRANGIKQEEIADMTGYSLGTVNKYVKDVAVLPKEHQRNPFEPINMSKAKKVAKARVPTSENLRIAEEIGDIDYILEEHEEGTRLICPDTLLQKIPLDRLQKTMDMPTDYHSDLPLCDWMDHYLSGKWGGFAFLKYSPYRWSSIQKEIFDLWLEYRKLMVETFRGVGKTMVADAIVTHEICEKRENNYAIISETKSKAFKRVKHVGDTLLKNKRIIADYGFLPHVSKFEGTRQRWTQYEITIKRETLQTDPSLGCFSSGSADATGAHYNGIIFDDVWSRNLQKNTRVNKEKWFTWRDGELEGCLENAWELYLLTRKGLNDLYQDLEDRSIYYIYRKPAVIKFPSVYEYIFQEDELGHRMVKDVTFSNDYEISDADRFDMKFFLMKKFSIPEAEWLSEYQLNPISASGQFFKWNNLRLINNYNDFFGQLDTVQKRLKYMRVIGFMDMAVGTSAKADYTALVILGYYNNQYYFLDSWIKRGSTTEQKAEMIRDAYQTFSPHLKMVYIEEDFQQATIAEELKKKCPYVAIQGFRTRDETAAMKIVQSDRIDASYYSAKQLRIYSQLENIVADKKLAINKNMRYMKEFKDEFTSFPDCKHFDILDALGNAISLASHKAIKLRILKLGPKYSI